MALSAFAPAAIAVERETGWPAEVAIAQWAAESGWGEKVTGANNYWGLTAATQPPNHPKAFVPTREVLTLGEFAALPRDERDSVTSRVDLGNGKYEYHLSRWFASFADLAAGLAAYVALLQKPGGRYFKAWSLYEADRNVDNLCDGIAAAGYASGPGYAVLLQEIAHEDAVINAVLVAHEAGKVKA